MSARRFFADFALAAAVLAAAACGLHAWGLYPASGDDFPRQALAASWAQAPYFSPGDYFWLPLPFWLNGIWRWLAPQGLGPLWYAPLSIAQLALAAALLATAARGLAEPACPALAGSRAANWARGFALGFFLSIPFVIRLSVGIMAEIPMLLCVSGFVAALVWLAGGAARQGGAQGRGVWACGVVALAGLSMTRYEQWPFVALGWVLLTIARRNGGCRTWIAESASAACALAIFPLSWIVLNYATFGDPLHFIAAAEPGVNRQAWLDAASPAGRMLYLLKKGLGQSLALAVPGLLAVWGLRRVFAARLLAAGLAGCGLIYAQFAFSDAIHAVAIERLALPGLALLTPLAAAALGRAAAAHGGWVALAAGMLIATQLAWGVGQRFGGPILAEPERTLSRQLEQAVGDDPDFRVIVTAPDALGGSINALRYYAGPARVLPLAWIPADEHLSGPLLLIAPSSSAGPAPAGIAFGQAYRWIDGWPME